MVHKWLQLASTPSVMAARARYGGAAQYARLDGTLNPDGPVRNDRLDEPEKAFIADRDGFYLASVSETGWPYVQHRGGPKGFLRVLDERTLAFADFRGNMQYVTTGNVSADDRVSLFLMDYGHRRRLKIFGRLEMLDADADPSLLDAVAMPDYEAVIERAAIIRVEAFDWNCPQHITPRFTLGELEHALAPVRDEIGSLREENQRLRRLLEEHSTTGPRGRGDQPGPVR
ncbi:pyridoxamine 5'-phosphate oxidase family protein [Methylopila sp. Yamaguchi]|uniref:pyridoxamine 5'-phosphate oxidase family protein n=1 Tax=Methylopila sp. Yamaguchi TaxID=1437817 RepID=UPI000CC9E770|nr:pyridoxamine 5'-phosphate oxidase family protein [Methylopila sp. Yamaguchi]GBD50154.1 pyridoxine 5`-phosphate oxidase [Methylopila sp. Yamaguchi]